MATRNESEMSEMGEMGEVGAAFADRRARTHERSSPGERATYMRTAQRRRVRSQRRLNGLTAHTYQQESADNVMG